MMDITSNPFSLEGKTILVTGASSGIGQATAIACSRMGARMVVTARDEQRLLATLDALENHAEGHIQQTAELTAAEDVERLISSLPPLDGAVLCAGNSTTLPLQFGSREKFDGMFDVNFFAPIELLRLLYKKKILNKGSSVVLVASIGGTHSFVPGNGVYGASKAAHTAIRIRYGFRKLCCSKQRLKPSNRILNVF